MQQIFAWVRERPWVSTLLGASFAAVVGGLFEYFMTEGEAGWIPLGAGLVGAAVMAVWIALMGKPEPQTPEPSESPVATAEPVNREPEKRIYTQRTATEIFAAIENMTGVEIDRFAQPHIGKWIRVQSVVRNITQSDRFFYVMLGKKFDPILSLAFSKARWSRIETMVQGDRIAAEGQIHEIDEFSLRLDHCELVELGEKDDILRQPKRPNRGTPVV